MIDQLRIAVLVDGMIAARYVEQVLVAIRKSDFFNLSLLIVNQCQAETDSRLRSRANGLPAIMRAYLQSEAYLCRIPDDAAQPVSIEEITSDISKLSVEPIVRGEEFTFCDRVLDELSNQKIDVGLLFGFGIPAANLTSVFRFGLWSDSEWLANITGAAPPGLLEWVVQDNVTSATIFAFLSRYDRAMLLASANCSTDRRLARRNRSNLLWSLSKLLTSRLGRLARDQKIHPTEQALVARGNPGERTLTTVSTLIGIAGNVGRQIVDTIRPKIYRDQWCLAIQSGNREMVPGGDMSRYQLILPPMDRFWADPFPLVVNGRNYVFFEEMKFGDPFGYICVAEVADDSLKHPPQVVLQRPYHLSYPFLFNWDGTLYMIPETAGVRRIELFKCERFPDAWVSAGTIMSNVAAKDTTLLEWDGRWWMFTTIGDDKARACNELFIFYAETPIGPWTSHPANPVVSDIRCGRMAGNLYVNDGHLTRLAQDCSVRYGYAIRIQRIDVLTATEYAETETDVMLPDWRPDAHGIHTFNKQQGFAATDVIIRRRVNASQNS